MDLCKHGYIYTVDKKLYNGHFLKFGFTKDPHSRLNTYKTTSPYPFKYRQLYEILHVPDDYTDFVEHDKVIEITLGCMGHGYSLQLFNEGGGCEFITGNYSEIQQIMENFGYQLMAIDIDDVGVEKSSRKSLKKSHRTLKQQMGLDDMVDIPTSNDDTNHTMVLRPYQQKYVDRVLEELDTNNKCIMKAPTGAGKTLMFYSILKRVSSNPSICIIFSPRRTLNKQNVSDKYITGIGTCINTFHYSDSNANRNNDLISFLNGNNQCVISSCIQSAVQLANVLISCGKHPNLVIVDECHSIDSWLGDEKYSYWIQSPFIQKRLFASATLTETFLTSPIVFGNLVEEVKAYELIKQGYLCNIETITKHTKCDVNDVMNNKHSIVKMTADAFTTHHKKKGMIFVGKQETAIRLYENWNIPFIKPFICISNQVEKLHTDGDDSIDTFNAYNGQAIIISCEMLVMGYDNPNIDLIVFADPTQSDVKLRQIVGRGLRKDPSNPDKILHCLLPIYQNEPEPYNCYLKYLYYLVTECGKDVIVKNGVLAVKQESDKDEETVENANTCPSLISNEGCPLTIWEEYCTNKNKSYIQLLEFLKAKTVQIPDDYNRVQREFAWLPLLSQIKKVYPMFAFQDLDVDSSRYYATKEECINALEECKTILAREYDDDYGLLLNSDIIKLCHKINKNIPYTDVDLYYQ
jgi:superfamily II DNA or RNA helicase